MIHRKIFIFCAAALLGLAAGCVKKQTVKAPSEQAAQEEPGYGDAKIEEAELGVPQPGEPELDTHGKDFAPTPSLAAVRFGFDSSEISEEARQTLAENAEQLKAHPDWEAAVEGHCDQRGTVGYNLALGQRRAAAVRRYYVSLGVNPRKLGAISYGEEALLCKTNTAECWAENRRAETKVRVDKITLR